MSRLLEEFPEHTYDQWHEAAVALLKGASFEKLLVTKTYEDITIQPIYRQEDIADLPHRKHFPGSDSLVRGGSVGGSLKSGWEVFQELRASSPEELNSLIHEGLNAGQSELNVVCGAHTGVSFDNKEAVAMALEGVAMDAISVWWQCGKSPRPLADWWLKAAEAAGVSSTDLHGGFQNDPISDAVRHGAGSDSLSKRLDDIVTLTDEMAGKAPQLRTICAVGDTWHNSRSSAIQELAYVIASVVAYVEELKERGVEPEVSLPRIRIRLAVGSDYFMEIAKIRAARWLWSRVADAYGVNAPVQIHASTSKWNKTAYDAHSNMLRVTSEAFAAVVAGVDCLHIGTYDEISGMHTVFSRRISRNLHTILREECGFDQVIDPAEGSSYIEWLTDQVAGKAWALFQEIESSGGMIKALEEGTVQKAVKEVCSARFKNIRRRKDRIVGANMYPDLKGKKLEMPDKDGGGIEGASYEIESLSPRRASEEYEALRDACNAFAERTGAAPSILQLNMGPSRRYRLRADWTSAFFEAAGFAVDGKRDFAVIEDAVAAVTESPALIAVITSDDKNYAEVAEDLAKVVKTTKPDLYLLLAGAPGDNETAWREAGIDDFVHVRINNYELNEQLLQKAGAL